MEVNYLILGAGITGLSCAAKLQGEDYLLLERESEIGGYCRTFHEKGFVWDFAGHFFHFSNPEIQAEFSELLSGNDIVFNKKCTKVFYDNKYIDYPFQYNIHQLEKEEFIDCLSDLFRRPVGQATNFQEMLYKKFGLGIADKFLIPYNKKLYACDLNHLDMNAMGRFFPYAEPDEIVRGFRSNQKKTYNETFFYSSSGAEIFVKKIAERIQKERIFCNTEVQHINLERKCVKTVNGEIHYKHLINTIPFPNFLQLSGIAMASNFSANQVLVFNLGFDQCSPNRDFHWIYYPDPEICFYRVGFYNNILHQLPMSVYVELGFPDKAVVDIDRSRTAVLCDLRKVGILQNHRLLAENHILMNPAYVHMQEDSNREKEAIQSILRTQQVYTIGRYGNWTYCSIEDCILQAYQLISQI